jgi:flagellin-like hook-associated protein FlgL
VKEFDHGLGEITRDLEALKLALIGMAVDGLPATDAKAMAQEISTIRLHLKRLEYDRQAVVERARRSYD